MKSYAASNNKPSTVSAKEVILRRHLLPAFGKKKLNEIGARDIETFKGQQMQAGVNPKTVNNFLTVLRKMLSVATEWRLLE